MEVGGYALMVGLILGGFGGYWLTRLRFHQLQKRAEERLERERKEFELSLREEFLKAKAHFEAEHSLRRRNLERRECRLGERALELNELSQVLRRRERTLNARAAHLDELVAQATAALERIGGLTVVEARQELLARLEAQTRVEAAQLIHQIKEEARQKAEAEARELVARAVQRYSLSHAAETAVSVVSLPSDELKGRIIGREGRNIRAFEWLTGAELVIDDTPGAVTVSAFDPLRRELAKLALERLISDGRIHPARIEEAVSRAQSELEERVRSRGEGVVTDLGIVGLHQDLVRALGSLYYRTSYGQNLLVHSKEVGYLASLMASELELDPAVARRAGLLHDIGKACDQSHEGPHALVGAEMVRRYGESEIVVNAIAAHHEEVPAESPYAFLVSAADALSGGRPGARRESFELYIKRLEKLEAIALSFKGVEKAYAIQAGREVRVLVEPSRFSDEAVQRLASQIAAQIEAELKYPGQIKVVVVKELRAIEYAR